ncbi:30S ribosomal protein S2 [Candidatus Uhrbacteria bacterium RIFCSPHIGHO2_12_FULL_60_25]|uniref:Small ribosomal subunit protein uS2 n=1 Tax=Candidatus Uhrbacteria bacterium RIFCSPHIGHO2_12_FULL_60_25 TaxID=1802399 RepID=A0A1F7UN36_9BACT|nr:MAG: 30S ribosomal protein S2 [Candidatus Uhrbacteria bacterium RIFCSPHIGHO2_02_FULL_60_44]OGL79655.1 MAG: 30S ribosomal protein S2 [Candidatus Uhrbacteria bacterium RIFCSPHIGHO2_12_FULL_60_25]
MPPIPSLTDLLQAGVHFGHQTAKWHPKMKKYIFGERQGIHIINLEATQQALERAAAFAKQTTARGGVVLFVGTKKQASDLVRAAATAASMPYVNKRWLGGTLTNYVNMAQLLRKYKELKRKLEKGELGKYTKFEQQKFAEQVEVYDDKIGGLADLMRIPDAVFILDIRKDKTALDEAQRRGVKIIAITDTNVNPTGIEYPIPANDDAVKSIELIANLISAACKEGRDEWEKARARLGGSLMNQNAPTEKAAASL